MPDPSAPKSPGGSTMTAIGPTESIHVFFWSTSERPVRCPGGIRTVRLRRVDRRGGAPREAVGIGEPVSLDEDRHFTDVAEIPGLLAGSACRITFRAAAPHAVLDADHRL